MNFLKFQFQQADASNKKRQSEKEEDKQQRTACELFSSDLREKK